MNVPDNPRIEGGKQGHLEAKQKDWQQKQLRSPVWKIE